MNDNDQSVQTILRHIARRQDVPHSGQAIALSLAATMDYAKFTKPYDCVGLMVAVIDSLKNDLIEERGAKHEQR